MQGVCFLVTPAHRISLSNCNVLGTTIVNAYSRFETLIGYGGQNDFLKVPGREGKLVWLSGAPGLGKSTSGMLLARNEGYVYYEADAFGANMNPYVSTEVEEPTLAMITQKFLKGVPQDRIDKVFEGVQQLRDFS